MSHISRCVLRAVCMDFWPLTAVTQGPALINLALGLMLRSRCLEIILSLLSVFCKWRSMGQWNMHFECGDLAPVWFCLSPASGDRFSATCSPTPDNPGPTQQPRVCFCQLSPAAIRSGRDLDVRVELLRWGSQSTGQGQRPSLSPRPGQAFPQLLIQIPSTPGAEV